MSGMEGCLSGALKWLSKVPQHALNCHRAIKLQNSLFQNPVTSYRGYKPAGGRIVDATPVSAPRQRMSGQEKERAKTGESASDIRPDDPAKAGGKTRTRAGRSSIPRQARQKTARRMPVPHFGDKNHISIDRKWRFVRDETSTDAARYDGHELASVPDGTNTSKSVRADTGYRSARNEAWLKEHG